MKPIYRQCGMCGNAIPHHTVTTSIARAKPVLIALCPMCDSRKCAVCDLPVPVKKFACEAGHVLK